MKAKYFLAIALRTVMIASIGLVGLFAGAGYWYVFILGSPQLDAPTTTVGNSRLTFSLETFNSKAMGAIRQYGLILPPDYNQNRQKPYPVIFLLHGGHDKARAWVNKIGIL